MIPIYALLAFALWTLLVLMFTIGVYRWYRILVDGVPIAAWKATPDFGSDFYRRAMRAHANCLETLPVFGTIVFASSALGVHGPWLDGLALATIGGRIVHSLIHLCFVQTDRVVAFRFTFLSVQLVAMVAMVCIIVV